MRLVFFGTPEFASRCLEKIIASDHEVLAVVTAPDKPKGRGKKIEPPDVKITALKHGLEVFQPEKLKEKEFISRLKALKADFYCVVAFRILPEEVFSMPTKGCVNLHASLLPKYRGAAPINWAIIKGEHETGLTTFFIRKKVDTGDIIMWEKMNIGPDETFGELHDRMAEMGGDLIVKTMNLIQSGAIKTMTQDEVQTSPAPKLSPESGKIKWFDTAFNIHNLIRGLSPRPGAYTYRNGKKLLILRSKIKEINKVIKNPGTIVLADPKKGIEIGCGKGVLELIELKPESGKVISGAELVRGYHLKAGEEFGEAN